MSRLLARIQRQELDAQAKAAVRAATEQAGPRIASSRSAEGDERRLRGIPAIGRGVSGEIPGTHPEKAVVARREARAKLPSA